MGLEEFYKHLNGTPDDWEYRSVFADWLFENNHPLEKAQRWMIDYQKHPYRWVDPNTEKIIYLWGKSSNKHGWKTYYKCLIVDELLINMKIVDNSITYNDKHWRYFWTLQDAEEALSKVLHENTRFLQTLEKQS